MSLNSPSATQEQERKCRQLTGLQPQGYGNAVEEKTLAIEEAKARLKEEDATTGEERRTGRTQVKELPLATGHLPLKDDDQEEGVIQTHRTQLEEATRRQRGSNLRTGVRATRREDRAHFPRTERWKTKEKANLGSPALTISLTLVAPREGCLRCGVGDPVWEATIYSSSGICRWRVARWERTRSCRHPGARIWYVCFCDTLFAHLFLHACFSDVSRTLATSEDSRAQSQKVHSNSFSPTSTYSSSRTRSTLILEDSDWSWQGLWGTILWRQNLWSLLKHPDGDCHCLPSCFGTSGRLPPTRQHFHMQHVMLTYNPFWRLPLRSLCWTLEPLIVCYPIQVLPAQRSTIQENPPHSCLWKTCARHEAQRDHLRIRGGKRFGKRRATTGDFGIAFCLGRLPPCSTVSLRRAYLGVESLTPYRSFSDSSSTASTVATYSALQPPTSNSSLSVTHNDFSHDDLGCDNDQKSDHYPVLWHADDNDEKDDDEEDEEDRGRPIQTEDLSRDDAEGASCVNPDRISLAESVSEGSTWPTNAHEKFSSFDVRDFAEIADLDGQDHIAASLNYPQSDFFIANPIENASSTLTSPSQHKVKSSRSKIFCKVRLQNRFRRVRLRVLLCHPRRVSRNHPSCTLRPAQ